MGSVFDEVFLLDQSQLAWTAILAKWGDEARERSLALIAAGRTAENGCIVTDTAAVRKVRFHGSQFPAYRFIYCALTRTMVAWDDVVRHRCHNRTCINPGHLELGNRADNRRDDWEYWANGFDPDYL